MIHTKLGIQGYATNFKLVALDSNGDPTDCRWSPEGYRDGDPIFNRIVDAGLDMPATFVWEDCFEVFSCGTGTSTTTDDMTKLEAYVSHGRESVSSSVLNGSIINNTIGEAHRTIFRTRTALTNTSGQDMTIGEVATSPYDEADADIFSRIKLDTPITVPDGAGLQFTYNLKVILPSNIDPDNAPTVTFNINGVDVVGEKIITELDSRTLYAGMYVIDSEGRRHGSNDWDASKIFEPASNYGCVWYMVKEEYSAYYIPDENYRLPYVTGSHQIQRESIFNDSNRPGDVMEGFKIGGFGGYEYFKGSSTFVKNIGREWKLTQTLSWGRAT